MTGTSRRAQAGGRCGQARVPRWGQRTGQEIAALSQSAMAVPGGFPILAVSVWAGGPVAILVMALVARRAPQPWG